MFKFLAFLFSKISTWLRIAVIKGKKFLKSEIPLALGVVELIKQFVESPATPLITKLIPGDTDDKIAGQLKILLPRVLASLQIVQDTANLDTNNDIIQAVINRLREMPKADRRGKYLEVAAKISDFLTDGKLTWAEINVLVQSAYDVQVAPKK